MKIEMTLDQVNKINRVNTAALEYVKAKDDVRAARDTYKTACDRFFRMTGNQIEERMSEDHPAFTKFARHTENEYQAMQNARRLERNALKRLETAARNS